jgi:hypothetical protein
MKSATLKGLACHTAFDAGNVGPDYVYGWGLLNMSKPRPRPLPIIIPKA